MKYFRKIISVALLFSISAVSTKGLRKTTDTTTTTTTTQPARQIINQPQPTPIRTTTPVIQQSISTMTYTDIYNALKAKKPDSSDFATLKNIKTEAERQLMAITQSVQNPHGTQPNVQRQPNQTGLTAETAPMKLFAQNLVQEYDNVITVNEQQLTQALKNPNIDIFSEQEVNNQIMAIREIAHKFNTKYPGATIEDGIRILSSAIEQTPKLTKILNKVDKERYTEITNLIKDTVTKALNNAKFFAT